MFRKSRSFLIILILAGVLFYALGVRNSTGTVVGGPHDLSIWGLGASWSGQTEEVCVYCHTPHRANTTERYTTNPNTLTTGTSIGGQFLWNRPLPANTFQPYTSDTYTFKGSEPQPGVNSLLCLSCHDGIGATNVLLNYPGDWNPTPPLYNQFGDFSPSDPSVGPLNIGGASCSGDDCTGGTDLRNDHPVGFDYDTAQAADSGIKPRTSLPSILQQRLAVSGNKVECSTCHDPHLTNTNKNMFLVRPMTQSQLCLDCHNK